MVSSVGAVETGLLFALTCPLGKKYVGKTFRTLTHRDNDKPVTGCERVRDAIAKYVPRAHVHVHVHGANAPTAVPFDTDRCFLKPNSPPIPAITLAASPRTVRLRSA